VNIGDSYHNASPGGTQGKTGQRASRTFTAVGSGGARCASAYDTNGKAPEGYPDRDCLCGSLCDACRVAYQTGKAHSDGRLVPTPKDLVLARSRLAIALQDDGWYVRSDIIWQKRAPMPESVTDRPTSAHEHIFLLTKQPKYF